MTTLIESVSTALLLMLMVLLLMHMLKGTSTQWIGSMFKAVPAA